MEVASLNDYPSITTQGLFNSNKQIQVKYEKIQANAYRITFNFCILKFF